MESVRGTNSAVRKKPGLLSGLMKLMAILLLIPGAASAAGTALNADNSYFFAASCHNSAGLESINFSLVDYSDPNPPTVDIVSSDSSLTSRVASIHVDVPSNFSVVKVQLFANGVQSAEKATYPYDFSWDMSALADGDYTISVKATDGAGNAVVSDPVALTIAGNAPTASIVAPPASTSTSASASFSITDAQLALRIAIGLVQPPADGARLDVAPFLNGKPVPDGTIDVADALLLLENCIGLVTW